MVNNYLELKLFEINSSKSLLILKIIYHKITILENLWFRGLTWSLNRIFVILTQNLTIISYQIYIIFHFMDLFFCGKLPIKFCWMLTVLFTINKVTNFCFLIVFFNKYLLTNILNINIYIYHFFHANVKIMITEIIWICLI